MGGWLTFPSWPLALRELEHWGTSCPDLQELLPHTNMRGTLNGEKGMSGLMSIHLCSLSFFSVLVSFRSPNSVTVVIFLFFKNAPFHTI